MAGGNAIIESASTAAGKRAPLPPPPLVAGAQFDGSGARHRLRGPRTDGTLPEEYARTLSSVPTTVADNGHIRFGDSLLLLSHSTEVLLQADVSRSMQVVDDSHSQRKQFEVFPLTTGKILHPCARNSFTVARADRNDAFGSDLDVHYGQTIRLLGSSFLCDQLLYLHLEDPPSAGLHTSNPVLLPRAAGRTLWRVVPGLVPLHAGDATYGDRGASLAGQVVRVNEPIFLENVETSRLLMSASSELLASEYGAECRVFAEELRVFQDGSGATRQRSQRPEETKDDQRVHATWSFVNDSWVDSVAEVEEQRTGGHVWKEDVEDDFQGEKKRIEDEHLPAFRRLEGTERQQKEDEFSKVANNPLIDVVTRRIFPALRAEGMHGVRKLRRRCVGADMREDGTISAHTFQGVLCSSSVRLKANDFPALCIAFACPHEDCIDYTLFFRFMSGIMPDTRLETVHRAYRKLRRHSTVGFVTAEVLMEKWNPRCHPQVQDGSMGVSEAFQDFASQWEVTHTDGHISPEDFLSYYADISMVYEDSDQFVQMLKIAYDL